MLFAYTILYVQNVPQTIEFYQKAFSLNLKFLHESNQYAELHTGSTTLAFASESLAQSNNTPFTPTRPHSAPPSFQLSFTSSNVPSDFQHALSCGASSISPPSLKPWGQTTAYITDPNGFLVEICSPITS